MFQLLKNTNFDFMKRARLLMGVSVGLMLLSVVVVAVRGLNLGIEFTGGTELQIKYAEQPDLGSIRAALSTAGLTSQVVTTIGDPADHEVYIRLGVTEEAAAGAELTSAVIRTLRGSAQDAGQVDLNVADETTIAGLLAAATASPQEATDLARAITALRTEVSILRSSADLAGVAGMSPEMLEHLRGQVEFGPFAVRSQSYVGPTIGQELLTKALVAIMLSLLMMLIYIWMRFQFQWGFAAVLALVHDTLITLGLFSLFQKEMSLPVVAAFLTLIGYSVNDTVVIFDRIRENLRSRTGATLENTINTSINQTLSRTVITSGLTWMSVLALYFFGGEALNPFSFVLCIGIVIGSYSTIFIASPFLLMWKHFLERRRAPAGTVVAGGPKPNLRSSSSGRP